MNDLKFENEILNMIPKAEASKEKKIHKLDLTKIKNIYAQKTLLGK